MIELLEQLREVADEVFVAVDSRAEVTSLGPLVGLVDQLTRFEFAPPFERSLAWAHAQCHGDWILRIDSDEVASPSLVSALRELIQANDVTHYYIPRRWLYPDATRWIDEFPWSSDYQIRLVRNDPAFLWFEGVVHSGSRLNGPSRYLEWPIYHLDCAVSSEESRAAKVASYRADPIRPEGLGPEFFYLPERYVTKSPRPVPYADIDAITRVVRAQPVEQGSVPMYAALSVTRRAEINRHWDRRALPPEAYRGALAMLEPEIQIPAGWRRDVHLRVINLGSEMWPGGADRYPLIRIGYRWLRLDGSYVAGQDGRSTLPANLPPRRSCVLPVTVTAPPDPGVYLLEVDLVHEAVRWFGCPVRERIDVSKDSPRWATGAPVAS